MENISDYCIVFITTNDNNSASNIARMLVSERLAACCSIIQNINSIYYWEGEIEESSECMLIIKTHRVKLEILEKKITEVHPYQVPEIISFDLNQASKSYLNWLENVLNIRLV